MLTSTQITHNRPREIEGVIMKVPLPPHHFKRYEPHTFFYIRNSKSCLKSKKLLSPCGQSVLIYFILTLKRVECLQWKDPSEERDHRCQDEICEEFEFTYEGSWTQVSRFIHIANNFHKISGSEPKIRVTLGNTKLISQFSNPFPSYLTWRC